ncbi:RluA family pseudouridine synthase [Flavonifractor sp. DFI.6.63]|uniref:RluA family pseudouridine synthase n=1 Tax=Flavonifractor sp. DFI.6.63 TaxID=2963704 RepID=UPI0021089ADD|nr:RluA family pseudouridine synthase [Flavonifractor sp. DFI.6.63]MCQ5031216.1 RluA family pseudouridine synthase [Flavonifractor sp. DFI.6.63]MDU2195137.1 RluA family pseudouridine synthase [Clostridiales bacterium]
MQPKQAPILTVDRADTLLPFLLSHQKGKSRNNIKALLTRGQVLVDGQAVTRHDHPLVPGQTVSLRPRLQGGDLPFPLLYEDADLLAIDKPAGLLSTANEREQERTAFRAVSDWLRDRGEGRAFLVHRLDRDTSGVLLFAKSEAVQQRFQNEWNTLIRRRGYRAVVEGAPPEPAGTIRTQLRENRIHRVYSVRSGGKTAVTHYQVERLGADYALLAVAIDTGRKNQIRVHFSELGCPVAGDKVYGAATDPLGRLCLHAHELSFAHPVTGAELLLRSETPRGFSRLVR